MKPRIQLRPASVREPDDQAEYLAQSGGKSRASQFQQAAEQAFERLAAWPQMGAPYRTPNPELSGLRTWPVPGFPKHRIFYLPRADGVEVLRVLHGARDLAYLLDQDLPEAEVGETVCPND